MNTEIKIVNLFRLCRILPHLRGKGKKIIFTNGCFDILHPGHVTYLEKAKEKNSILVVGLNSDKSVNNIKDKARPINSQIDRAKVLASLECVDYVVIFKESTPLNIIKAIKPDVLVKGADWRGKLVVGQDFVERNGGRVKLATYLKKYSTTKIINQILKACRK